MRVLVTGSRDWTDEAAVRAALKPWVSRGNVLVHGGAVGLDTMAERIWRDICSQLGIPAVVERHFARDHADPLARNAYMVDLGASVCLAFAKKWASGSGNCARTARKHGIKTYDMGVKTL